MAECIPYSSSTRLKLKALRNKSQKRRKLLNQLFKSISFNLLDQISNPSERKSFNLIKNLRYFNRNLKFKPFDTTHSSNSASQSLKNSEFDNLKSVSALIQNEDTSDLEDYLSKEDKEDQQHGPKNDYCQNFVDCRHNPQNFIRDAGLHERFDEYPKLKELLKLKDELVARTNTPKWPLHMKCPLRNEDNSEFKLSIPLNGCEFDVVLVEPPLLEYQSSNGTCFERYFSWDEIKNIDIGSVTSARSFLFLWCGSADGLDKGRECLKKWGYRRCEDISWIKLNRRNDNPNDLINNVEPNSVFHRTKEHCLMGIKGTVVRSTDTHFIHTNIDIDLIITEEQEYGVPDKPQEIFHIIERFCLGKRRLYLFGRDNTVRPGWVTLGPELTLPSNFDPIKYKAMFEAENVSSVTGTSEKIESLRPKTPPPKVIRQPAPQQQQQQQQQQPSQQAQHSIITQMNQ